MLELFWVQKRNISDNLIWVSTKLSPKQTKWQGYVRKVTRVASVQVAFLFKEGTS